MKGTSYCGKPNKKNKKGQTNHLSSARGGGFWGPTGPGGEGGDFKKTLFGGRGGPRILLRFYRGFRPRGGLNFSLPPLTLGIFWEGKGGKSGGGAPYKKNKGLGLGGALVVGKKRGNGGGPGGVGADFFLGTRGALGGRGFFCTRIMGFVFFRAGPGEKEKKKRKKIRGGRRGIREKNSLPTTGGQKTRLRGQWGGLSTGGGRPLGNKRGPLCLVAPPGGVGARTGGGTHQTQKAKGGFLFSKKPGRGGGGGGRGGGGMKGPFLKKGRGGGTLGFRAFFALDGGIIYFIASTTFRIEYGGKGGKNGTKYNLGI